MKLSPQRMALTYRDDYQKGTYLDILFLDDNDEDDVRSYKMVGEDDEKIYFEYIG